MYKIFLIGLILVCTNAFSQLKEKASSDFSFRIKQSQFVNLSKENLLQYSFTGKNISQENFSANKFYFLRNQSAVKDSNNLNRNSVVKSRKSPGLAFLYSLFIPGMGQLYAHRFDVGKYFMISEASLWLGYASFTVYSNWLLNDAYKYAAIHAGVNNSGKDPHDAFYVNISNYDNVTQYNNDMLEKGQYSSVYYPGTGYDFYWNSVAEREQYRSDKLASDRIRNDRLFIIGAVLVNHLISAISAIVVTNHYNSDLGKGSGGVSLGADVIRNFERVDGIQLKMTKWF